MATDKNYVFLTIDEDLNNLEKYSGLLQELGYYYCLQAEDGIEAWALLKNFDISFVVCAFKVPELNGLAILRYVRGQADYASIPFVLTGSEITPRLVVQAGRIGVSDIIVTPCPSEMFKSKIKDIIEFEKESENIEDSRSFKRGLELMKRGRTDEALREFEKVITVQENAEVYYNMGYIKAGKGEHLQAIIYFRKATRIKNDYARAHQKMGEIYAKLGKKKEAESSFQQAADIYMERNQNTEAEEIYETVLKLRPNTINVYNSLGIIYRRQGRFEEAIEQYKKALKVHPFDENVYFNLGRVYTDLKKFKEAETYLRRALQIDPDFSAAKELIRFTEMGISLRH